MTSISIDIGASGGKIMACDLENNLLEINEIYRFSNGMIQKGEHLVWDIENLFSEILNGLKIAKQKGINECSIGVCTWGVDYVMLDKDDKIIGDIYAYRDKRTDGVLEKVTKIMPRKVIYEKTGIQFLPFNTLYQLFSETKERKMQCQKIMLLPDYIYFRLTGKKINEITNMSTGQLLNIRTKDFDLDLLNLIGLRREQFCDLVEPGTILGNTLEEYSTNEYPRCVAVVVGTHDTASAVAGLPLDNDSMFLSIGTWGLIGCEISNIQKNAILNNQIFTNEYGVYDTIRYLKNVTGMWFLQEIKKNLQNKFSYSDLVKEAEKVEEFDMLVNCNDEMFTAPTNMFYQVMRYLEMTKQHLPVTVGDEIRCVIDSIAMTLAVQVQRIEQEVHRTFSAIVVAGGGSKNKLFCQTLANLTKKEVRIGFDEITSLGNLIVQKIGIGEIYDLDEGRKIAMKSFDLQTYTPNEKNYTIEFSKFGLLEKFKSKGDEKSDH